MNALADTHLSSSDSVQSIRVGGCRAGGGRGWLLAGLLAVAALLGLAPGAHAADQVDVPGPAGSGQFGQTLTVLANGNVVVTDPSYDIPSGAADVGAVYLYNGATHAQISMLTGSTAGDQVGSSGVITLTNGNFVIRSQNWDNGTATDAGAVTWGSGETGVSGVVSAANSLVGSTANDQVGSSGITTLSNGAYVVLSQNWDNGTVADAGAVTWGSGNTGVSGVVSAANSLVGSAANDQVGGWGSITTLSNGAYVVRSPNWDNGTATNAGAVTWGSGDTGISGLVSAANSLVGSTANDGVGDYDITALSNGNIVVRSPYWDNGTATDAGAVTWGSGATGVSGVVGAVNSLVGTTANNQVGSNGVTTLGNGAYVVSSPYWDNGTATDAGAVTWITGTMAFGGAVTAANSLVGSTASDLVGSSGVTALSNDAYVVGSSQWDNGTATDAGAVTWASGEAGVSGVVSASNSLVGSTANNWVGSSGITALGNGAYVVRSPYWDNGAATDVGAVTWGSGATGVSGVVGAGNSLVGSTANDQVGIYDITALGSGAYVVRSPYWDNGATTDAGAVTWGSGETGVSGVVGAANSLVGSTASEYLGGYDIIMLSNGNYVIRSPSWDNGAVADAGAVTWGSGTAGVSGVVSSTNSLVGSTANDGVGSSVTALSNGAYVVASQYWDNGTLTDAGAVTWITGTMAFGGAVTAANSLVGSTANDQVGSRGITALTNGAYVVRSTSWDNGAVTDAGAVTWGSGDTGVSGVVSASNSLVGSTAGDQIGRENIISLANGAYVVSSPRWDNGTATDAGAVTWGSGDTGVSGIVSAVNSLVGSTANDQVGKGDPSRVQALGNGNYVVRSPDWDNGGVSNAGAVTWGSGDAGISGVISVANSLVGSTANDRVGSAEVTMPGNGNYVVRSPNWDNGAVADAGAVTWGDGTTGVAGFISTANSVVGGTNSGGSSIVANYDATNGQLVVGRPADNIVTFLRQSSVPMVTVAKTASPESEVGYGRLLTYTLILTNTGGEDPAVLVTDTLPAGVVFAGWIEQSGAAVANDVVAWSGAVNTGTPITISFQVTNSAAGGATITNTVQFSGTTQAGSATAAYTTATTLTPSGSGSWSDLFPPCTGECNYVIPPGVTVTLDGDINLSGNLEIQAGAAFNPNGKTVTLTGDEAQTLTGNPLAFYNLVVNKTNKSDTVTIVGKLKVSKKLTVRSGKLISASDYGDIEIEDQGELVLTNDITVSGHFTMTGNATFTPNTHAVLFDGATDQNVAWENFATFWNLTVMTGTTLIDVNPADNVHVENELTNYGTIRKTQPVESAASYYFGLAGVYPDAAAHGMEIEVTDRSGGDPLTAIRVDRIDKNHPNAPRGATADVYWSIAGTGSDFVATVVLPQNALADPLACRYASGAWNCARSSFDSVKDLTVTRTGVTAFSDWAVYSAIPTTTTLATSANPASVLTQVTWTATVAPASAAGSVEFFADGASLGTATLAAGKAQVATGGLTVGTHVITATFTPAGPYLASNGALAPVQQVVSPPLTARNDAAGTLQGEAVQIDPLANDIDPAGGGLTVAEVTQPSRGTVVVDGGAKTVMYTPDAAFTGLVAFAYTARDIYGITDEATVAVVVTARSEAGHAPQIGVIDNASGSTLDFDSGRFQTQVQAPAGSYPTPLGDKEIFYLTYTPVITPTGDVSRPPGSFSFAGMVFDLSAFVNDTDLGHHEFPQPLTLVISYDPALLGDRSEQLLTPYYWNGTAWAKDGLSITHIDTTAHRITFQVWHLSEFALFAKPPQNIPSYLFLPVVTNRSDPAAVLEAAEGAVPDATESAPRPEVEAPVDEPALEEAANPVPESVETTTPEEVATPDAAFEEPAAPEEMPDAADGGVELHLPLIVR